MPSESKKILLLGRAATGKTSMRTIIFSNNVAEKTMHLKATMDFESSYFNYMGSILITLVDCGGQKDYLKGYLKRHRSLVFKKSDILVYLISFDSEDIDQEIYFFVESVRAVLEYNESPNIFLLFNKSDLVVPQFRNEFFDRCKQKFTQLALSRFIEFNRPHNFTCFPTSIFNESLYNAWSSILQCVIPNLNKINNDLRVFGKLSSIEQAVLLERSSLLVIASYVNTDDDKSGIHAYIQPNDTVNSANSDTVTSTNTEANKSDKNITDYIDYKSSTIKSLKKMDFSNLKSNNVNSQFSENNQKFDQIIKYLKEMRDCLRKNVFDIKNIVIKFEEQYVTFCKFTENTYLMLVNSSRISELGLVDFNIEMVRSHFLNLEKVGRRSKLLSHNK